MVQGWCGSSTVSEKQLSSVLSIYYACPPLSIPKTTSRSRRLLHLQPLHLQSSSGEGGKGRRMATAHPRSSPHHLHPIGELGHKAKHSCKGNWEMQSSFGIAPAKIQGRNDLRGKWAVFATGRIFLWILLHRWENLEVSNLTKVTALIGDELGFAKSYFVTLLLMYLAMVRY